jgi:DNA-binding HxlR family transcriptional regulator
MKNKKVSISSQTFKTLISEDTLHILHALDKHSLSLDQLKKGTALSIDQLNNQLKKLADANVIKTKQRNDKEPTFSLTLKGSSLLHPETSRIMILFGASIITLSLSISGLIQWITQPVQEAEPMYYFLESDNALKSPPTFQALEATEQIPDPLYSTLAIGAMVLFIVLISLTIWRYNKNKPQAL